MINNLQSILTQDHLSTSDPVYTVYSKQEIVVDRDYDYDKVIYARFNRYGEGDTLDYETYQDLESAYNEATDYRTIRVDGTGEEVVAEIPKDPFDDEKDFNPDEWEQKFIKLVDRFEQAFFIRENAENFLASQRHNIGEKAYIYVESAYRNPEWQQIRELLIAAAKKNENSFGELKFGLEYKDIVDGMWVVYSELPISNYANSLKRIWKTDKGWSECTVIVEWEGKYVVSTNEHSFERNIWDLACYAPVKYDEKIHPLEFMNKVLPLTIKGEQD